MRRLISLFWLLARGATKITHPSIVVGCASDRPPNDTVAVGFRTRFAVLVLVAVVLAVAPARPPWTIVATMATSSSWRMRVRMLNDCLVLAQHTRVFVFELLLLYCSTALLLYCSTALLLYCSTALLGTRR